MENSNLLRMLVAAGLGSRRKMASLIKEGRVSINGEPVTAFNYIVDIETERVDIDGIEAALGAQPKVYLALNKPAGVLSTTSDDRGRKTVMDFVPDCLRHLKMYPVGRLDKDSTGLILLTNDGEVALHLSHPRYGHEKEYLVRLNRFLESGDLELLSKGIELDDGITRPAIITRIRKGDDFACSVVIHEGKKHIVRRMFARLGYVVLELKRIRISGINLGGLKSGEIRRLAPQEISRII
ncbi:MAG: pseudouridine synthase [Dehalococcoidales bacterium]|nr:pseudouridine synthase [Dehalococcoidales bacterium]